MADDMFFADDRRALRRGRRSAARTETCRPCIVWVRETPDTHYYGVVLDISPYGMRIRMVDALPQASEIGVQLMRDEEFTVPLAAPIEATVARCIPEAEGFVDHGVRIVQKEVKRMEPKLPPAAIKPRTITPPKSQRMYTLDVTVGEEGPPGRLLGR